MAGEKKGVAFEVVTYLALEELGYVQGQDLHWGKKPKGFTIDPDFTIGEVDKPKNWLMLTSTGAAKNFEMKFWRNTGELFEAKKKFDTLVATNLSFESTQKKGLQLAMSQYFDGDLHLDNTVFGKTLLMFVDKNLASLPDFRDAKIAFLREQINKDPDAKAALQQYAQALEVAIAQHKPELDQLWNLVRQDARTPVYRLPKVTYVRRGIAKLMVFPEDVRQQIYQHVDAAVPMKELPEYALTLGFAQEVIGGVEIGDLEIKNVIQTLGREKIEYVIQRNINVSLVNWIESLRNLSHVELQLHYIFDNYEKLTDEKEMLKIIKKQFLDPQSEISYPSGKGLPNTVWIIYLVFNLLKVNIGKKQGYGLSELAKNAQKYLKTSKYPSSHTVWRINLPNYMNRNHKSAMPEEVIMAIAGELSNKLSELKRVDLLKNKEKLLDATIKSTLEDKMVPYRMFEPIKSLIEKALKDHHLSVSEVRTFPSFIGEMVGSPNQVATTPVIRVGTTLIHWKSAYDSGKGHKVKELAGRAQAMRYQYHPDTGSFTRREGVEKLILVIDGTFNQKEINTLMDAGWDEIYYPDELDDMIKSITNT